jgi:site-specific DNA-methyltransferase (adenine-specific)
MSYTLHLGNCLEVLPMLEAQSVDAILTDLPYGTTACKWDSVIPFAPMWEQVKRVLKPRGVFVTTASQPFTSALVMSNLEWFKYEWIWEKDQGAGFINASIVPLKKHENILVFSDGTIANGSNNRMLYHPQGLLKHGRRRHVDPKDNTFLGARHNQDGKLYTQEWKNYPVSLLYFQRDRDSHPTQKPVALYEYLILTYTNAGDTVLDFVMGSGTTGVACAQTGRNFIGIELDPDYFKIAEKRISEASAQERMPLEAK